MRFLAIDLGDRRTGLAVADDELRIPTPLKTVEIPLARRERLLSALADTAREEEAGTLVVGLPLNMDDTEGPRAKLTRAFADDLARTTGLPVVCHDERTTSERADEAMARSGLTHKQKKARRDSIAAAAILSDYLDTL